MTARAKMSAPSHKPITIHLSGPNRTTNLRQQTLVSCTLILATILLMSCIADAMNLAAQRAVSLASPNNLIANGVVVHQIRFIENKSGRTDYALAGETIELSCYYMMKDEAEDVKQIIWSKDGKNFLKWRKNKIGLEVLNYTFKGHIDQTSINSHLIIHNVTIDMHGKYKCQVKTDLGMHELEYDLIVISQTNCRPNDWRIMSDQIMCREQFRLDCRNMFPKPVPSCGLWNDKLDKFIRSVTVDISEEPNKETYRVKYLDKFELPISPINTQYLVNGANNASHNGRKLLGEDKSPANATIEAPTKPTSASGIYDTDLLQFAGHLSFKCDIIVPETSWKLSLAYKMFDHSDGCLLDPLETIERMRANYSQFAATRMQQAGYMQSSWDHYNYNSNTRHQKAIASTVSSAGYVSKTNEGELEMLASSLRYELLPAPRSNSSKIELNCWRKPRPGTLARLSCSKSNHVKLIGTNLLECRPDGQWHPISLETSNRFFGPSTSHLHPKGKKIPRKYRSNQQQQQPDTQSNDQLASFTRDLLQPVGNSSNNISKTSSPLQLMDLNIDTGVIIKPVEDNGHQDDDTEDNDDSTTTNKMPTTEIEGSDYKLSSIPIATTTEEATTTSTTPPQSITTTTIMESTTSLYEPIESHLELSNLTPAQLAALLPNCVSTISRGPKYQHRFPSNSDSKPQTTGSSQDEEVVLQPHHSQRDSHPLMDDAVVQNPSLKYQQDQGAAVLTTNSLATDGEPFNWNWFSVFATPSSAASSSIITTHNKLNYQRSLNMSITWLTTLAVLLYSRPLVAYQVFHVA